MSEHKMYLGSSEQVPYSTQEIIIDDGKGGYGTIYHGESTPADILFMPAIMRLQVEKTDVHFVVNPDDLESGMYDQLKGEGEPE